MDRSRLFFRIAYLIGLKPWDSGVPPPELRELTEGENALPPGRALDLGCGTGTNCVYLAERGWEVTGVDYMPRAIRSARRKAKSAGVDATFAVADVTELHRAGVHGPFDLLLDIGCFHSLPANRRGAYSEEISRVAAGGSTYLLFAFAEGRAARATTAEIAERFGHDFELVEVRPGAPTWGQTWYRMLRR